MAVRFTRAQTRAIDTRDKTLLVSAAAGAGKTSTLSARIIGSLCSPSQPAELSRMLIITFTRASAADLQAGIRKRLQAAKDEAARIGDTATASRLNRTLSYLPSANIRTVDSFLFDLIRTYRTELGLPSELRIADGAEADLLAGEILDKLIDEIYSGEHETVTRDQLAELSEALCATRTEKKELPEILLSFYRSTVHEPGITDKLRSLSLEMTEAVSAPFEQCRWAQEIFRLTEQACATYVELLNTRLNQIAQSDPEAYAVFADKFDADIRLLENIPNLTRSGYTPTREALKARKNVAFRSPLSSFKEEPWYEPLKQSYEHIKKKLAELVATYYSYEYDSLPYALTGCGTRGSTLCKVLQMFDERFTAAKLSHKICDYPDLEKLALRLLYDREGALTPAAEAQRARFDYVYVDEYQDINESQHRIISAVSRPDNCFMVGDIKQAIYRFRGAAPDNFASMRRAFPPFDAATDSENAVLHLSENFRSDAPVIDFVNSVFDLLFTAADIGYRSEDDALIHGKQEDGCDEMPTLYLLDSPEDMSCDGSEDMSCDGSEPESDADDAVLCTPEASFVAEKINELLALRDGDGRAVYMPGDIAILLRSAKGHTEPYISALSAYGIPCMDLEEKDFFLSPEILLALCLLNSIDNPRRDIYLSGLMMSPIYGFTPDDLTVIRGKGDDYVPLFCSLEGYCASHPEDTHAGGFVADIRRYRELASAQGAYTLICRLFDETGLYALCGKDGPSGRTNLNLLCEYARRFESNSFYGLHAFIDYINQMIKRGKGYDKPSVSYEDRTKVQLMTIHSSKGLERKVCFVCRCSAPFRSVRDDAIAFDSELGLGLPCSDSTGFLKVEHPIRSLIYDRAAAARGSDEMRLLYVAMTRAKERLYMIASPSQSNSRCERLVESGEILRAAPTPYALLRAPSYTVMMLAALGARSKYVVEGISDSVIQIGEKAQLPPTEHTADPDTSAMFSSRFAYAYPHGYLRRLPGRLSVSRLFPGALDGTENEVMELQRSESGDSTVPRFISGSPDATAADAGTATHKFMQFCAFERLLHEGVDAEISSLESMGFLSDRDCSLINREHLRRFRSSELLRLLTEAQKVYREQRFLLTLPARDYTEDPELRALLGQRVIPVQGVIDCVVIGKDGSMLLCDYKTDRLSEAELHSPELARQNLSRRHGSQLYYYRLAAESIWHRTPDRLCIYSLPLGMTLDVDERYPVSQGAQPQNAKAVDKSKTK